MARTTQIALPREGTHRQSEAESEKRWPPLHSALFVLGASVGLWVMIIAGVSWLVG